jgi:hypothetical protein
MSGRAQFEVDVATRQVRKVSDVAWMASDRVEAMRVALDRKAKAYEQRAVDEKRDGKSSVDGWRFTDNTPLHHDEIGNHSHVSSCL